MEGYHFTKLNNLLFREILSSDKTMETTVIRSD